MIAIAIQQKPVSPPTKVGAMGMPNGKQPKRISWEDFQRKYLEREDEYKYEWLNGFVEKTKRTMNYLQFFIIRNLVHFFDQLKLEGKVDGMLIHEGDTFFLSHHRRPDIAYFTDKQIDDTESGIAPVPQFVIEVISNNDMLVKVQEKMLDYENAKVPVVWHVYPQLQEIHVYHGKQMTKYRGAEICSAAPALTEFALPVSRVFQKRSTSK